MMASSPPSVCLHLSSLVADGAPALRIKGVEMCFLSPVGQVRPSVICLVTLNQSEVLVCLFQPPSCRPLVLLPLPFVLIEASS